MSNPTQGAPVRKAKKSFTLSLETVAFLEMTRIERNAESVSSVLEEILQNARREHERAATERAIAAYYDSLSSEELAEQSAWGELALREFADQDTGA